MTINTDHNLMSIDLIIDIKLIMEDEKEYIYQSRKISDQIAVLEHNKENTMIAVGSKVVLQVCSTLGDEEAHPVNAEVTQISDEGIELRFIL